jgi:GTP cyclohydrolase II
MTARTHGSLLALGPTPIETEHGPFLVHRFVSLATGQPALAVTRGDLHEDAPLPTRVHSSCITSEAFGACDCDCAEQLDGALAHIALAGRGILFYLTQEGRGAGFVAKAFDRMLVQASGNALTTFEAYDRLGIAHDQRRYDEVAWMLRLLDVHGPLALLTNNPGKLGALEDLGVHVAGTRPLEIAAQSFSRHYLAAKSASGHRLHASPGDVAVPPEPVVAMEPEPVPGAPGMLRIASYMLPVRAGGVTWFRLHVALDPARRRERVVLVHGQAAEPLVRVQRERLLERLPLRDPGARGDWARAVEVMRDAGGGAALFVPGDDDVDDADAAFLASCLRARRARLLGDGVPEVVRTGLGRHGVTVAGGVPLPPAESSAA